MIGTLKRRLKRMGLLKKAFNQNANPKHKAFERIGTQKKAVKKDGGLQTKVLK